MNRTIVFRIFLVLFIFGAVSAGSAYAAAFAPGNLVVCRVGDGVASLTSAGTAVFLDEYTTAGTLVQSIPMPTTVVGANQILVASGSAANECAITRSTDGNYILVTGYNAPLGTAAVATTSSATFPRVIGRVDVNGTVDTTTTTTGFASGGIRSATSDNGTNLWALGSVTGVVYNTLGGSGAGTTVSTTATNMRVIGIFGGNLYIASGAGTIRSAQVGTGLPTTTGQTIAPLAGMPTATNTFNGFFFADLDAGVAGVDTLYICSDIAAATPATSLSGGLLKFSLVGGTWTYNGTFPAVTGPPVVSQTAFFGLTGTVSGTSVTLYAEKAAQLLSVTDTTGYNVAPTANLAQLATPVTNTAFRGIALTPNGGVVPPTVRSPYDFDGDGKTDLSIFRPSAGEWWYQKSSNGGNAAAQFGNGSDKIVPGDYTGDNKADFAIFRPSTGEWFILRSEDFSFFSFPFGVSTDVPAPGDFDGDHKTDATVFRPSTSTWFTHRSSDGANTITTFGISGDVPVVGDYDGDGKADIAIYRPGPGEWWLQRSTAGLIAAQFGATTDKPVQGDYTGDGKTDIAFWRPSTGEWFVLRSNDFSFFSFPFGTSTDVPSPGDYDGDGKFDAGVFRPSSSTWFVNKSGGGTLIAPFGTTGDISVPNAYVR